MSTLVEAVSVVIPRHVLDVSYPGGCDAYLEGARRTQGVRFVVADARLTSVSLATLDEATAFVRPLEAIGLTTPDGRPLAIACVDEHFGPTAPAPWLRWRRHDEGYTSCWLEWTEPGELALPDVRLDAAGAQASTDRAGGAPDGSAPEPFDPFAPTADASTDEVPADEVLADEVLADEVLTEDVPAEDADAADADAADADAADVDDADDVAFDAAPVALADAVDTDVTEATEPEAHPPENDPDPDEAAHASDPIPAMLEEPSVTTVLDMTPTPTDVPAVTLLDALREGLGRQGWRHGVDAAQGAAFFQVSGWRASYAGSAFVDDAEGLARVYTHIPVRVPEHRRAAAVELLTRVNHGLPSGNFEFDYSCGEVRFKATADCGPHVTPAAVDRLLQLGVAACDRVHDPMMQVIYGGVEAEVAVNGEGVGARV